MNRDEILKTNKCYWDTYADLWFGTTALPTYGVHFVTEDELQLFGDVSGKKMLELCCGSGHSLKYHADRNASELWGVDLSHKQIENARRYLSENGYTANFICSPMEADMDIPKNYFDYIYSIYGIGWTTDLDGTFQKISSYLKKDGIFITEQVGENNERDLVQMVLPDIPKPFPNMNLTVQRKKFEEAGFKIIRAEETYRPITFYDIGAFVWFAHIIEWEFPNFSVSKCYENLLKMQDIIDKYGKVQGTIHRYLIVAQK